MGNSEFSEPEPCYFISPDPLTILYQLTIFNYSLLTLLISYHLLTSSRSIDSIMLEGTDWFVLLFYWGQIQLIIHHFRPLLSLLVKMCKISSSLYLVLIFMVNVILRELLKSFLIRMINIISHLLI